MTTGVGLVGSALRTAFPTAPRTAEGVVTGGTTGRPVEEPADRGDPDRRDEDQPEHRHERQRPHAPAEPGRGAHRVAAEDGERIAPARMRPGVSEGGVDRPVRGVGGSVVEPRRRGGDRSRSSWSCGALLRVVGARVCFEGGPESPGRVMEAGAGRADRHAQDVGDLRQRQAGEVLEDEDRPLLRCQPPEATLDLVAVGDAAVLVPRPRCASASSGSSRTTAPPRRPRFASAVAARTMTR